MVQTLFPNIDLWVGVLALALLAAILSVTGGLGAVVVSDTIQACVLILGGTIIYFVARAAIPSWEAVEAATAENALSIIQPLDDPALPWPGLFTGVLIIGIYFWVTNQMMVQRVLGAKSLEHGRWGAIFAGFLKLPILYIMILPGVFAVVLYPDLPTPDLAFPTLAFDLLPIGLRGLILAALIAAITSTVDSILNSASTVVTMDFVRPLNPNVSDKRLVFWGRVTTGLVTVIAVIWSPQIQNFPSLWQYLQSILSFVTPPVVAVFLIGIFWERANANAAFITFVGGVGLGIAGFFLIEVAGAFELHFLYAAGISFALSVASMILFSVVTPSSGKEVGDLVWTPAIFKAESAELVGTPWYLNYRYQSVALLLTTAVIVVAYW